MNGRADQGRTELRGPLGALVTQLCEAAAVDASEAGAVRVTALALDLPVELDVYEEGDGSVRVRACPPTQRVATTYLPVFHRMTVRIVCEEARDAR